MKPKRSPEQEEWLADYLARLETAKQEWHATSVAKIKARPLPEEEEGPKIIVGRVPE